MTSNTLNTRPEFYRLPPTGPDPFFGLTRAWYYAAEKRGDIRLVRLRERGKLRGVTLVSFDAIGAYVRGQVAQVAQEAGK